jgi:N-acyl-L-homoserine lactone synthetase
MNAEVRPSHFWDRSGQERAFADRADRLLTRIDCRRADDTAQREAISRLRSQAYLRDGAISPSSSRQCSDQYDETDNAYLFALYVDGELASSLRVHVTSEEHLKLPSLEVFPNHLQPALDAGKVLVDTSFFVTDEKLSRIHRDLPYVTFRICVLAAEYFRVDHCLATAKAEHQAFYRRAFNYRKVCQPRLHPQMNEPVSLMALHFPSAANELYQKYPFFRSSSFERRRLFERPERAAFSMHEPAA